MNDRLRARIITEWRGLADEGFTKDTAKPTGPLVEKLLGSLGLNQRIREDAIKAAWSELVGEFLSKHAAPAGLNQGVLVVHVLQPTVHFELERVWKRTLLTKLQERFGKTTVREVRFRLG
jgi:predicted nucleic acid-binding Zn ribbon protein